MRTDAAVRAAIESHAQRHSSVVYIAHEKTTDRIYLHFRERTFRTDYHVKFLTLLNSAFSPKDPVKDEPRLVAAVRTIASFNKDNLTIIGVDDYETTIKGIVKLADFQKRME
jgi:hypothetical protein